MINTEEFIRRIELLLDYHQLSASAFADKIGIQRSSLSHLLSGRNNPSLDFVLKVTAAFPETDLYWLLQGAGKAPGEDDSPPQRDTPLPAPEPATDLFSAALTSIPNEDKPGVPVPAAAQEEKKKMEIERIVVFFKDGTFSNYMSK